MLDFTQKKYSRLLEILADNGYRFFTFEEYCVQKNCIPDDVKFVILRHDVDLKPRNSLAIAKIERFLGVNSSYYFRVVEQSNKPEIIKNIVALGHEIGYHYEDMAVCEGQTKQAIAHFEKWLRYFRQYYPVKTICMHGSPRSEFDGRELWKEYDYHDYGIIGEPYFDVDFSKLFYLTDTGRRWDGFSVSVRDRIPVYQDVWLSKGWVYHATDDVIEAILKGSFPNQLMLTTHPQRWTNHIVSWLMELVLQNVKNVIKKTIIKRCCKV